MAKVNITIDGKALKVEEGTYVLEACRELGLDIPAPCRYPFLEPRPACRLCAVEIQDAAGASKIEMSCNTKVREGMVVGAMTRRGAAARGGRTS